LTGLLSVDQSGNILIRLLKLFLTLAVALATNLVLTFILQSLSSP
jgi:hypothetical protein